MAVKPRVPDFDPFRACLNTGSCLSIDINLVCNLTNPREGHCACRPDFRWNHKEGECQLYLDVDCSSITYDTPPSPVVLKAVNATLEKTGGRHEEEEGGGVYNHEHGVEEENGDVVPYVENHHEEEAPNTTMEASLQNSLLTSIDPATASEADIREAFCRDVDSFSFEFGRQEGAANPEETNMPALAVGLVFILLLVMCCCCACVASIKSKIRNRFSASKLTGSDAATGMAVVGVAALAEREREEEKEEMAAAGGSLFANPNYQAQATPVHPSLPYPIQPGGGMDPAAYPLLPPNQEPAPIPPTQPGYTNTYPPAELSPPNHPQPQQQQQPMPYPPPLGGDGGVPFPPPSTYPPYYGGYGPGNNPPYTGPAYPPYPVAGTSVPLYPVNPGGGDGQPYQPVAPSAPY
jgi:hypothetical protein